MGDLAEYIALISIATHGSLSPEQILMLPKAQGLQLRSIGLLRQNVRLKSPGGNNIREQIEDVLGEWLEEWTE